MFAGTLAPAGTSRHGLGGGFRCFWLGLRCNYCRLVRGDAPFWSCRKLAGGQPACMRSFRFKHPYYSHRDTHQCNRPDFLMHQAVCLNIFQLSSDVIEVRRHADVVGRGRVQFHWTRCWQRTTWRPPPRWRRPQPPWTAASPPHAHPWCAAAVAAVRFTSLCRWPGAPVLIRAV